MAGARYGVLIGVLAGLSASTAAATPVDLTAPEPGIVSETIFNRTADLATATDGSLTYAWTQVDAHGQRVRAIHVGAGGQRGPIETVGTPRASYGGGNQHKSTAVAITSSGRSAVVSTMPLEISWLDEDGSVTAHRALSRADGYWQRADVATIGETAYVAAVTDTGAAGFWRVESDGDVSGPVELGGSGVTEVTMVRDGGSFAVAWVAADKVDYAEVSTAGTVGERAQPEPGNFTPSGNGTKFSDLQLATDGQRTLIGMNACFNNGAGNPCWNRDVTLKVIEAGRTTCLLTLDPSDTTSCAKPSWMSWDPTVILSDRGLLAAWRAWGWSPNSGILFASRFVDDRGTPPETIATPAPDGTGIASPQLVATSEGAWLGRASTTGVLAGPYDDPQERFIATGDGEIANVRFDGRGSASASSASAAWTRAVGTRSVVQTSRLSGGTPDGGPRQVIEVRDVWSRPQNVALTPSGAQVRKPATLRTRNGRTIAAWVEAGQESRMFSATVSPDGVPGDPVQLCPGTPSPLGQLRLAETSDGDVILAFADSTRRVYVTAVPQEGAPACTQVGHDSGEFSQIELHAGGGAVRLYTNEGGSIVARRITVTAGGAATAQDPATLALTGGDLDDWSVGLRPDGSGAVVWTVPYTGTGGEYDYGSIIRGARLEPGGTTLVPTSTREIAQTRGGFTAALNALVHPTRNEIGASWSFTYRDGAWIRHASEVGLLPHEGGPVVRGLGQSGVRTPLPIWFEDDGSLGFAWTNPQFGGYQNITLGMLRPDGRLELTQPTSRGPAAQFSYGRYGVLGGPGELAHSLAELRVDDNGVPQLTIDPVAGDTAATLWPSDVVRGRGLLSEPRAPIGAADTIDASVPEERIAMSRGETGADASVAWVGPQATGVYVTTRDRTRGIAYDAPPTYNGVTCPDVWVLQARGSGEPAGESRILGAFTQDGLLGRLERAGIDPDRDVHVSHIDYPAVSVPDAFTSLVTRRLQHHDALSWSEPSDYGSSVDRGTRVLSSELEGITTRCGDKTEIVVAGYSQGAEVVGDTVQALPRTIRDRIAATILFADPRFNADDSRVIRGTFTPGHDGLAPRGSVRPATLGEGTRNLVRSYCRRWDLVCQSALTGCTAVGEGLEPDAAMGVVHASYDRTEALPPPAGQHIVYVPTWLASAGTTSVRAALAARVLARAADLAAQTVCRNDAATVRGTYEPATETAAREAADAVLTALGHGEAPEANVALAGADSDAGEPAPTGLQARMTVASGLEAGVRPGEQITVNAAASRGASPIVRYDWDIDGAPGFERSTGVPTVTLPVGTQPGPQTITVRVVDRQNARATASTTVTVATDAPTPPGPVTGLTGRADATDYVVGWAPPSDTGGLPVEAYLVTSTDAQLRAVVDGTAREARFPEPKSGVTGRTFTVTAMTAKGPGPQTTVSTTISLGGTPAPGNDPPAPGPAPIPGPGVAAAPLADPQAAEPQSAATTTPPAAAPPRCALATTTVRRRGRVTVRCTPAGRPQTVLLTLTAKGRRPVRLRATLRSGRATLGVGRLRAARYTVAFTVGGRPAGTAKLLVR